MPATVRPDFAPLQAQIPEGITTIISASSSPLSSPTTPLEGRLYPRPLNIFKRPSRRSLVRRTTLVNSIPKSISEAEDTALVPRPLSIASTPAPSPTQLPRIAISPHTFAPAPASIPPTNPASPSPSATSPPPSQPITPTPSLTPLPPTPTTTTCTLCASPLLPLQTYTLPKTAPSLTSKIHTLYPTTPTTPTPTFCTTCFTTIRALVLCWSCGDPIHRPEERIGCGWAWWHWGCVRCLLCRAPLPPPPWTHAPTTLSVPPSCKPCTRELRELAYAERIRKQALNPVVVRGNKSLRGTSNGGATRNEITSNRDASSGGTNNAVAPTTTRLPRNVDLRPPTSTAIATQAETDPSMSRKERGGGKRGSVDGEIAGKEVDEGGGAG
ncbi:hypothetical protein JMJ35_007315 [Cladonia borealis]|uniref:LIM zinc-binding domain-containing protein n=1 Tax=Cladonia borealis TaxID=184061 RepID=A0AA39U814_9LECA|nr:hypothetical protein JMJ35_007315 [Cladonia borealis]